MAVVKEFKEFALKGNMMELAIGIVIGIVFGAVVTSLVNEIIMPIAGYFLGGRDFQDMYFVLGENDLSGGETLEEARAAGATVVGYGAFINAIITFLIVAWAVFLIVKAMNRARAKRQAEPEATETMRPCPECVSEIPRQATRCKACGTGVDPMPA